MVSKEILGFINAYQDRALKDGETLSELILWFKNGMKLYISMFLDYEEACGFTVEEQVRAYFSNFGNDEEIIRIKNITDDV